MNNDPVYKLEYRNWLYGIPPKRTKLDIDGWAGENTWKTPQPWHCKPYSDAATYGIDLIYSWSTTCTVTCDDNGKCHFDGDFTNEKPDEIEPGWEPFASFAPYHFGYVSMVDIKTPPNHNLMVVPHPRFYACRDGTTPVAVPGVLEMDWWPSIFFIVFKAPMPGCKYIFKKGDPVAQFQVVPRNLKYDIQPMSEELAALRDQRQQTIEKKWHRVCTRVSYCEDGNDFFDNKYKVLSNLARREGNDKVEKVMDNPKSCPHYYDNPQVADFRTEKKGYSHNPWTEEQIKKREKKKQHKKELGVKPTLNPYKDDAIDGILSKNIDKMSNGDFNETIYAIKREKRRQRKERSMKLKGQSNPRKYLKILESKEEWVLGHKIEKIK